MPGPQQLRQQEKREQKLKDLREQVAQGKLVTRQMTAKERKRYPARDAKSRPPRQQAPVMARFFLPQLPRGGGDVERAHRDLRKQAVALTGRCDASAASRGSNARDAGWTRFPRPFGTGG
jgi:hypothetical protein